MNITGDAAKARIAGQAGYAGTVKSVINSALKRVGRQQYGKYDVDTYTDWKWNQVNPPRELNCWASVVNWAWHGSAINSGWLQRYVNLYVTQITDIMTKNAGMATLEKQDSVRCFLLGQLNSVFVHNVTAATDNVVVPPG